MGIRKDLTRALLRLLDLDTRLGAIETALVGAQTVLLRILTQERDMVDSLEKITREVNEMSDQVDSGIRTINGLADLVRALPAERAAIDALAAQLDSKAGEMAAAIANVPPIEAPPAPPVA